MSTNSNIVDLQKDIFYTLTSWDALNTVNVVQQRKLRLANEIAFATIYTTARNGGVGIGILIEMPQVVADPDARSAPGPNVTLVCSLLLLENPTMNLTKGGTDFESCEQLGKDYILPFVHQWLIQNQGEFYPEGPLMVPANDIPPGVIGYRITFRMVQAPPNKHRVTLPSSSIDGSFNVTLTNSINNTGAQIYYTLDGSTPAPSNSVAKLYSTPFSTTVGQILRYQAYLSGMMPSDINQLTINP